MKNLNDNEIRKIMRKFNEQFRYSEEYKMSEVSHEILSNKLNAEMEKVNAIIQQEPYNGRTDFWNRLRNAILSNELLNCSLVSMFNRGNLFQIIFIPDSKLSSVFIWRVKMGK